MENIKDFNDLTQQLEQRGIHKRVAVVCPNDESTIWALDKVRRQSFIDPILVDNDDPRKAAREAISLVRQGKADILMKGLIGTDVLLHEILDREEGILVEGELLTHITAAAIPTYDKLLFFTDAAVIPRPTQDQRVIQVRYLVELCHGFGIEVPRVALIHASEKVDERHFPYTAGYQTIKEMARQGQFGRCIVDGPLDVKTACNKHAMDVKRIVSPIKGQADALVFPDIESANAFYKALTLFCGATTAGILRGASAPVVLPSRGDSPETKFNSIALACVL